MNYESIEYVILNYIYELWLFEPRKVLAYLIKEGYVKKIKTGPRPKDVGYINNNNYCYNDIPIVGNYKGGV